MLIIMDIFKISSRVYFFYFLFNVIFISEGAKNNAKAQRDVLFRTFTYSGAKAKQMCNGYTTQACNGILSLRRYKRSNSDRKSIRTLNLTEEEKKDFQVTIVGGRQSRPKEYPHVALLGYGKYSEVKWHCGGSLISESFILSAAHCVSSNLGNPTWTRLGELDLASTTEDARTADYQIIKSIVHPGYKHPRMYNDIALFKFRGLSSFTDYIRPICLNVMENIPNQKFIAIGWGSTGYGEMGSSKLLSVELDVQNNAKCNSLYTGTELPNGFNASTMLCVGYAPGGKDSCQGDSGGPLQIVNYRAGCSRVPIYTQIGIVSFGENCALPDTPAIYTRVSYFIPWIESIVWNN